MSRAVIGQIVVITSQRGLFEAMMPRSSQLLDCTKVNTSQLASAGCATESASICASRQRDLRVITSSVSDGA